MLRRVMGELPKLTGKVVGADIEGDPSYDITTTGAGEAVREPARRRGDRAQGRVGDAPFGARGAQGPRRRPRGGPGEGRAGIRGRPGDRRLRRPQRGRDHRRLPQLSQIDLSKIDSYERRNRKRTTILARVTALRGDEPWPGYDELTVAEVQRARRDDDKADEVARYERAHKNRAGVIAATERESVHAVAEGAALDSAAPARQLRFFAAT